MCRMGLAFPKKLGASLRKAHSTQDPPENLILGSLWNITYVGVVNILKEFVHHGGSLVHFDKDLSEVHLNPVLVRIELTTLCSQS